MTIKQVLQKATSQFKKNKIKNPAYLPEADREAEILLFYILKKPREFLFTYPEKKLTGNQINRYRKLISRRLKGEPIAYLTGHKEFYGLDFVINKNVLIPRPETELMVEEAVDLITHNAKRITLIDVGTGSGCIIISLAKRISDFGFRISDCRLLAVDISKPALAIAKKNARLHQVNKKIKFVHGNLLKPVIRSKKLKIVNCKLIILSNLPYLTPYQIKSSPTIKYEPKTALDGGRDGLNYYKKLFRQIKQLIRSKTIPCSLLCEIDQGQTQKIKKLAQSELPKGEIKIVKDLAKKDRIMSYASV